MKTMPFRPNPRGRWGLPAISSLRAVVDVKTSTSVSRLDLPSKTHRRWSRFGWYRALSSSPENKQGNLGLSSGLKGHCKEQKEQRDSRRGALAQNAWSFIRPS